MLKRCILCSFSWNCFLVFVQNISKNANYEEFLTKFVNTNHLTHNFLHGVIILQDAKNCSQRAKIFEAWQKLTFCRVDKRALVVKFGHNEWTKKKLLKLFSSSIHSQVNFMNKNGKFGRIIKSQHSYLLSTLDPDALSFYWSKINLDQKELFINFAFWTISKTFCSSQKMFEQA